MKVIHDIIDYLLSKNIIDDQDREYLRARGIYPKLDFDHFDYEAYYYPDTWYGIDDDLINKSKVDEESFQMEQDLEKKRPLTRKPKSRYRRKKLQAKHVKAKVVKETLSALESISWRPPVIINTHDSDLEALINKYFYHSQLDDAEMGVFSDVGLFWDWAYQKMKDGSLQIEYFDSKKQEKKTTSADHLIKLFITFSEEIIKRLEKQYGKREHDYIRPAAFYELLEIPEMVRDGWSLKVQLRDGNQLQITDPEGRLILEK